MMLFSQTFMETEYTWLRMHVLQRMCPGRKSFESLPEVLRWYDELYSITQQEPESKESWRSMDEDAQQAVREGPFSHLDFGVGELVKTTNRIIKVLPGHPLNSFICSHRDHVMSVWIV